MFKYWNLTLDMELTLLEFVKSVIYGTLDIIYCEKAKDVCFKPPIHIRCMMNLKNQEQSVYAAFMIGKFVVQKNNRKFSQIGLNHNHEHQNSRFKGVGGATGLTENDSSLRRWLISGREIARLLDEFELAYGFDSLDDKIKEHHDSNKASQVLQ